MLMESAELRTAIDRLREYSKVTGPVQVLERIKRVSLITDPTARYTLSYGI